jgi:hypothetical protein
MAKDYVFAYKGILEKSAGIQGQGVVVPLLPANINPAGQELLAYLRTLKQLEGGETLNSMQKMLVERALPEAEQFYTDVTGNSPDYGE